MKKQVATFLITFFLQTLLNGYSLEVNGSYDYFRGIPDGSWNGNSGALIGANGGLSLYDCVGLQLGGSYALYNWEGRGNVVFSNPKEVEQIGFITAGLSSSYCNFNGGLVYDRMFSHNYSIYNLSPSIDQLRFQGGYTFYEEEVGLWSTLDLSRSHKKAAGLPVAFKTIGQINLFWSHRFTNSAKTTLWMGLPYRKSLRFPHGKAGNFIAGFSVRAPLCSQLYLDGNGSYMAARNSHGSRQSRNYGASLSIGLTYLFSQDCECDSSPYMSIANHSNFFVESSVNQ